MMFEPQIAAGMKLLDEKMPGWHQRVRLPSLRMSNCADCVLGQLTGNFWNPNAAALLGVERWSDEHSLRAEHCGFAVEAETEAELKDAYTTLTLEWRDAIIRRRAGGN